MTRVIKILLDENIGDEDVKDICRLLRCLKFADVVEEDASLDLLAKNSARLAQKTKLYEALRDI